mgnify:FL=1
MQLFVILATLIGIGSVLFALQNNVAVTVSLLAWQFESSLAMVLLLAFAVGGLAVALVSTPSTLKRQWANRRQGKRIHELETDQAQLLEEIHRLQQKLPEEAAPAADPDRPQLLGLKQILLGRGDDGAEPPSQR